MESFINLLHTDYPKREDFSGSTEEYLTVNSAKGSKKKNEWTRLSSDDGRFNLIIDDHVILILHRRPYTHWSTLRDLIQSAYEQLQTCFKFNSVQNVGLRYINRVNIPDDKVVIHKYFNVGPELRGHLNDGRLFYYFKTVINLKYDSANCIVSLEPTAIDKDRNETYPVRLDLYYIAKGPVESNIFLEWLEKAHDDVENLFIDCTTEECQKMYEVKK